MNASGSFEHPILSVNREYWQLMAVVGCYFIALFLLELDTTLLATWCPET